MRRMPTDKEIDVIKKIESGDITGNIFIATLGVTTLSEIDAAYKAGKILLARDVWSKALASDPQTTKYYNFNSASVYDDGEYNTYSFSYVNTPYDNGKIWEMHWDKWSPTGAKHAQSIPTYSKFAKVCTNAGDTPNGVSWKDAEGNTITGTLIPSVGYQLGTMYIVQDHFNAPGTPKVIGLHTYVPTNNEPNEPLLGWEWVEIARNVSMTYE